MRVALYRRAGGSHGLAAQEAYIQSCLNRHPNWDVVAEYADVGPNAYDTVRPGLQRLLDDAADQKFDIALAQSATRFAPDGIKVLKLATELSRSGVDIKFANGIDYELMPIPNSAGKNGQTSPHRAHSQVR